MRNIICFLLIGLMIGCSSEVDLEQPAYDSKIVVDGWIEPDEPAHVFLTRSSPFLTQYDSASIRASFLNYAKITLTTSSGETEVLTLFREKGFFPPFVYKSVDIRGVVGLTYDIKIELSGHVVTASTTIPDPPVADMIWYDAQSDSSGLINVKIHPSMTEQSWLYTQVKGSKGSENYHPSYTPCYYLKPGHESFDLPILRSRQTNLYLTDPMSHPYNKWPKYQYAIDDTVMVKVGAVDQQSYNVLKSLFADQLSMENPFAFNGTSIVSNINGGIGRWTGIASAPVQVIYGQAK